jgi:hypothetical protein
MRNKLEPNFILMVSHKKGLPRISPTILVRSRPDIPPKENEGELVGTSTDNAIAFFYCRSPFSENYKFEYRLQIPPFRRPCYISVEVVIDDKKFTQFSSDQLKLPAPEIAFQDWECLLTDDKSELADYVRWKDKQGKVPDQTNLAKLCHIDKLINALDGSDKSVHASAIAFLKLRNGQDKQDKEKILEWLEKVQDSVATEKVLTEFAREWSVSRDEEFKLVLNVLLDKDDWRDSVWDELLKLDKLYHDEKTYVSCLQKRLRDNQKKEGFSKAVIRFIGAEQKGDSESKDLLVQISRRDFEVFDNIPIAVQKTALDQLIRIAQTQDLKELFYKLATNIREDVAIRQKAVAILNEDFFNAHKEKSPDQKAVELTSESRFFDMNIRMISDLPELQKSALKALIDWAKAVRITFSPDDYIPKEQLSEVTRFRQEILKELEKFNGDIHTRVLVVQLSILLHAPKVTAMVLNEELFNADVVELLKCLREVKIIYLETLSWLRRAEKFSEKSLQVMGEVNICDTNLDSLETHLRNLLTDKKHVHLVIDVIRKHRLWSLWDEPLIFDVYRDTSDQKLRDSILEAWKMVLHPKFILDALNLAKRDIDINHLKSLKTVLESVKEDDALLDAVNSAIRLAEANDERSGLARDVAELMKRSPVPSVTSKEPEDNLNSLEAALREQSTHLRENNDNASKANEIVEKSITNINNQIADHEKRVSERTDELSAVEKKIKQNENQSKDLKSRIDKLNSDLRQDISEDDRRKIRQQIKELEVQQEKVEKEIGTQREEKERLEKLRQQCNTEIEGLKVKKKKLNQELAQIQQDIQSHKTSTNKLSDLWEEVKRNNEELNRLNNSIVSESKNFISFLQKFEKSVNEKGRRTRAIAARKQESDKFVAANSGWDSASPSQTKPIIGI